MQYDAVVIGGSFAGLSAAIHIARARRSVCIIDTGSPRNRFASRSHGFFGQDGDDPRAMIEKASAQLRRYPTVRMIVGAAISGSSSGNAFDITLESGEVVCGTKLVLAFGISDVLPELPGLAERWGKSVLHCPYCHGFEFSDTRLGVLQTMPMSAHQALLIADWGPTTLYLNGGEEPTAEVQAKLAKRNVTIEPAKIMALHGGDKTLSWLSLGDGREVAIDALYLAPRSRMNSPIAEQLDGVTVPVLAS